jgi:hypothetical protein
VPAARRRPPPAAARRRPPPAVARLRPVPAAARRPLVPAAYCRNGARAFGDLVAAGLGVRALLQ